MEKGITRYDDKLKKLEEDVRFYISTPERFAEALIFAKKLKKVAETIEAKVKSRGGEIMSDKDLKEIVFGGFKVQQVDPTKTVEYLATSVIAGLGIQRAISFLKVNGTDLKKYIIDARIEGEELTRINLGRKEKMKKGYIKLIELKDKK